MTATPPLAINRAGGCVNISVASTADDSEFDAVITDRHNLFNGFQEQSNTVYSWVRAVWSAAPGPIPHIGIEPGWPVAGTFNLRRNPDNLLIYTAAYGALAIPVGQFVRVKPMSGIAGWFVTDSVGGIGQTLLSYKDWGGNNVQATFQGRDLLGPGEVVPQPPPILPPPGVTVPPAPTGGPGGG